ncbi:hypothetical protein [Salinisphaera sp. LB1]|uniref:hypothetical protein n=1 Tax=Salinisphaera sp. LB1 TaxID=2183911 RepID=UPI000D706111|nr:hypothetical protein [Salinisphaera sp. LB1]
MKYLIVALALAGAGCAPASLDGRVGYGRIYQSYGYGYGYPGYATYPLYGYGDRDPVDRRAGHREYGHWPGDRDRWRDHGEIPHHRAWPGPGHGSADHEHDDGERRHDAAPSMREHHWHARDRRRGDSRPPHRG